MELRDVIAKIKYGAITSKAIFSISRNKHRNTFKSNKKHISSPPLTQVDSVKYGSAATTRKNNREHPAEVCAKKQMHSSCLSRLSPENTSAPLALSHCISTDRSAHMVLIDTGHPPP